jgi:8-oxo-dGTP diphosphatase
MRMSDMTQATTSSVPTEGKHTKHTEVAVGVLLREDGALLLTSRPEGKPCAGFWEFPGGKIEAGETVEQALQRELEEELGICIAGAVPWKVTEHLYPHALVRLHWCKVVQWTGELQMREGQQMAWQQLPVTVGPVLPGTYPALDWLAQERGYVGATVLEA